MIPRYSRPEMADLWSDRALFSSWLEVARAVAEAQGELGWVPPDLGAGLAALAASERPFDIDRIHEIERETRHDVIAFLTEIESRLGPVGRWLHFGLTSSDLIDTALALRLVRAADLIRGGLDRLCTALESHARAHKYTPCVGRSHGIHAEPTSFGLKLAGHWAAFDRARRRLAAARAEIATCQVSGPVGSHATTGPELEARVAARLGLAPEPVSTQVIPRDRHGAFMAALAVTASSIEALATEIRHLQRTELGEVAEPFGDGQKGSSAMPHKRNPVLSENLTGLARLIRAQLIPMLENVALWHERDISHSSVERIALPEALILLDFALHRQAGLIEGMEIDARAMAAGLARTGGLIHSQRVLLALAEAGMGRQDAYHAVQAAAMAAWRGDGAFADLLAADDRIAAHLSPADLAALFETSWYLRHVDALFARLFGEAGAQGQAPDAGGAGGALAPDA